MRLNSEYAEQAKEKLFTSIQNKNFLCENDKSRILQQQAATGAIFLSTLKYRNLANVYFFRVE